MDLLDWITAVLAVIVVVAALKYPIDCDGETDDEEPGMMRNAATPRYSHRLPTILPPGWEAEAHREKGTFMLTPRIEELR